jgi:serine/threonine-protein kinase OSR1/STK39
MAPEVMEQEEGYDFKADIWSLGITAIELAQGDAPNSELPAMRVLMIILNSAPPTLSKHDNWSQEFRNFVSCCLQKDPQKRPDVNTLLKDHQKFFEKALDSNFIKSKLLKRLPPLE